MTTADTPTASTRPRILSGVQPSADSLHLGNYVGAIRPAIAASRQPGVESFFFLADYHALIKCDDPARIARSRVQIAATWLAAGLDASRVTFYRQSDIPETTELCWLLTCVTAKGQMNRAHAYKAAVDKNVAPLRRRKKFPPRPIHHTRGTEHTGRAYPAARAEHVGQRARYMPCRLGWRIYGGKKGARGACAWTACGHGRAVSLADNCTHKSNTELFGPFGPFRPRHLDSTRNE